VVGTRELCRQKSIDRSTIHPQTLSQSACRTLTCSLHGYRSVDSRLVGVAMRGRGAGRGAGAGKEVTDRTRAPLPEGRDDRRG
jgi:hypothetical protein